MTISALFLMAGVAAAQGKTFSVALKGTRAMA